MYRLLLKEKVMYLSVHHVSAHPEKTKNVILYSQLNRGFILLVIISVAHS